MLRYVFIFVSFLFLPLLSAPAQVFVSGGVGFPTGPEQITDFYNSGLGAGAGFTLENTAYPYARLRPQGVYQKFKIEEARLREFEGAIEDSLGVDVMVDGGDMGIIFAGADLQLRLPYASITPYLAPAVGVAFLAVDDITIEGSAGRTTFNVEEEETAFALGIGAGLAASVGERYELFIEGHYMYAFTEGDNRSWIPTRFGVALNLAD